jgi:two-component system, response regulator PdtaR
MTNGKLSRHAILIVEDDQLLKLLTVDIVEGAGFVALQADNADEAMAILEARSDIALLLTDINMPGSMDGLKLAHAVRNRWPPIKIIVVSSQAPDYDLPTGSRFFAKPYHAEKLMSEIRSLMAARIETAAVPAALSEYASLSYSAQTWR